VNGWTRPWGGEWRRSFRGGLAIAIALGLSGCGFALGTRYHLPRSLAPLALVAPDPNGYLALVLRERLERSGFAVVSVRKPHASTLTIQRAFIRSRILAVNGQGEPAEYLMSYHVRFTLLKGQRTVLRPTTLRIRRTYFYLPLATLAMTSQAYNLTRSLESKAARLILLRLSAPRLRLAPTAHHPLPTPHP
jgi:LPS-assembly lipoprotein